MPKSRSRKKKRPGSNRQKNVKQGELNPIEKSRVRSKIQKRLDRHENAKFEMREKQSSGRKISEVVLEMVRPLMKEAETLEHEKKAIDIGILAWNIGVIKGYQGEEAMQEFIEDIKDKLPETVMQMLMDLARRKCSKFRKYNQFIFDYEIKVLPGSKLNLTVAYESVNS
jgi:hypothetical protein